MHRKAPDRLFVCMRDGYLEVEYDDLGVIDGKLDSARGYIAEDVHYRRVNDLLETTNKYLERARKAELELSELRKKHDIQN